MWDSNGDKENSEESGGDYFVCVFEVFSFEISFVLINIKEL